MGAADAGFSTKRQCFAAKSVEADESSGILRPSPLILGKKVHDREDYRPREDPTLRWGILPVSRSLKGRNSGQ